MTTKEYVYACECGTTLKFNPGTQELFNLLDTVHVRAIVRAHIEAGHERVESWEAAQIRSGKRSRRSVLKK